LRRAYLDYAATTPLHPEVREAMEPFFGQVFGNPSSIHSFGREARLAVEQARQAVAALIGADPAEIVFTSGGTEADNLAVLGAARLRREKGRKVVVSAVEHHAVLNACRHLERREGFEVVLLPVDGHGRVNPEELLRVLDGQTVLVSVMLANNETGTLQPVRELARLCRERGVLFHTDAVQAVGHIPVNVRELGVDLLSLSAHKFYGPKGAGALYVRRGVRLEPLFQGGGQERRIRPGTENVAGIVGLGAACRVAAREMAEREARVAALRGRLEEGIRRLFPEARVNGHPEERLPGILNVVFPGVEGEALLLNLDLKGVAASAGAACSAGSVEPSHVLLAMGLSEDLAHGAVRFSLGRESREEDVEHVLEVLPPIVERLRRMRAMGEVRA
jgi:cysteine desulfurase